LVSGVVIFAFRRHLDVLAVGEDEAGTSVSRRPDPLLLVVAATLATSAAVSVSGLIGFVGIIVPHLVRLVAGSELSGRRPSLDGLRSGVHGHHRSREHAR
jgi:iron complex transport system permease protein